jgi:hypothetical protein
MQEPSVRTFDPTGIFRSIRSLRRQLPLALKSGMGQSS